MSPTMNFHIIILNAFKPNFYSGFFCVNTSEIEAFNHFPFALPQLDGTAIVDFIVKWSIVFYERVCEDK